MVSHYFWPGLTKDTREFVKHIQFVKKTVAKGRIPPAPIGTMPIIGTPF